MCPNILSFLLLAFFFFWGLNLLRNECYCVGNNVSLMTHFSGLVNRARPESHDEIVKICQIICSVPSI